MTTHTESENVRPIGPKLWASLESRKLLPAPTRTPTMSVKWALPEREVGNEDRTEAARLIQKIKVAWDAEGWSGAIYVTHCDQVRIVRMYDDNGKCVSDSFRHGDAIPVGGQITASC